MQFITYSFAIFFILVFIVSWLSSNYPKQRKIILILSSFIFYGFWNVGWCGLLLTSIVVNYFFAKYIFYCENELQKKVGLYAIIVLNILFLGFFKYQSFIVLSLNDILSIFNVSSNINPLSIVSPIGISFYTFQAISYQLDIFHEEIETQNFIDTAFYLSFFPQLLSGPIIKAENFFSNIIVQPNKNAIKFNKSFMLIISGIFKKMIIANYISAELVDPILGSTSSYPGLNVLLAVYGYSIQIYCDFSAYSDMAIGFAGLLGYIYPINFNRPYSAATIQDFWKRWHISLSSWLMFYLFRPLQIKFRDHKNYGNILAIIITFFLCGLWHGAGITFILWGLLHGIGLALERFVFKIELKNLSIPKKILGNFIVFNFVSFAWIFFRSENISEVWEIFAAFGRGGFNIEFNNYYIYALIILGLIINYIPEKLAFLTNKYFEKLPVIVQGVAYAIALIIITSMGPNGVSNFIYFNF